MSSILDPDQTFTSLADEVGLDYRLRKAIARLGYSRPTLVQSKCLSLAISSGRDLLVRARTGSGKTLAYCLPVLQKILMKKTTTTNKGVVGVGAVILVPTRELCSQIHEQLNLLTHYCDDVITVSVLSIGRARKGEKSEEELDRQEAMLRDHPDIIVATPYALLSHIRSGALDLKTSVETLVVDEADLVLSFGNSDDMPEIIKSLPRIYQGMLMSATLSTELETLKKIVLNTPVTVKLEQDEAAGASLKQFFVKLPRRDKNLVLYVFLKLSLLKGKGLIFVNSTDDSYRLKLLLEQFHIRSAVLNAELPFRSRQNIIEQFNIGNFDYLIATDSSADAGNKKDDDSDDDDDDDDVVDENDRRKKNKKNKKNTDYGVSRGMDFQKVSFVVNFDMPPNHRSYAHRVGRTARGGAKGVSLTFVDVDSVEENAILDSIQDSQPKIPLAVASTDNLHASLAEFSNNNNNNKPEGMGIIEQSQPVPLDFNLKEIEGFRYRVEDVQRAVTKTAIQETRAAEIRAEILNSERLLSHFEENPADLQILIHDRVATHISRVQTHLKHVPNYMLPRGMQVAKLNRKRKKRLNAKNRTKLGNTTPRSGTDPLRNFDPDGTKEGGGVDDEKDLLSGFMDEDDDDEEDVHEAMKESSNKKQRTKGKNNETDDPSRVFANTKDGTGYSTSGRNVWKAKHKKGQFSDKKRKSELKYKSPLGI